MLSSLSSTIRTVLGISAPPATPSGLPLGFSKDPPRPRRANGQNLSKTLAAIRYGKANGDGENSAYHPENRRKSRDSGARLHGLRPRAPRRLSCRDRHRPGGDSQSGRG